eukprot:SAG11_NODE_12028_length_725_cov_1.142173_2_plen_27_part_01
MVHDIVTLGSTVGYTNEAYVAAEQQYK